MHELTKALLALTVFSPCSFAQFTSPPGYLSTEGMAWQNVTATNGSSEYLGRFARMRYQQLDGEIKKRGTQRLTRIGYRPDHRSHHAKTAMGRTWKNVELVLSEGRLASMSTTWSANQLTSPTTVFSGAVTWPTLLGTPRAKPAPWGTVSFPFGKGGTSVFVYSAKNELCLDYTFTGGTLANFSAWYVSSAPYLLDGLDQLDYWSPHTNIYKSIGPSGIGDCRDSAHATGYASAHMFVGLYGKAHRHPTYAGKAVLGFHGYNTAPNSYVLHAIGTGGSSRGVQIPTIECYNLMIDLSSPHVLFQVPTGRFGARLPREIPIGDLSVLAPLRDTVRLWSQAAWADSTTTQTKLTAAVHTRPDFSKKLNSTRPLQKVIFHFDPTSPIGNGPYVRPEFTSITRYN